MKYLIYALSGLFCTAVGVVTGLWVVVHSMEKLPGKWRELIDKMEELH